ncbi:hypothetical protein [Actinoplanes auranticolor]|uniref:Uncharacterized protein n=1 Tax=Actinoplanes auranticolor TaxID=47988 RepID=A0A919SFE7_9ACTN|nr:hypothetical protein [Actinoplanes auranticolor]GIM70891.1 hypothetical protein Aau02nite_43150 [Actinoplanes auranticolor]
MLRKLSEALPDAALTALFSGILAVTTAGTATAATSVVRNTAGGDFVNVNWFSFGDGAPSDAGWATSCKPAYWIPTLYERLDSPTHKAHVASKMASSMPGDAFLSWDNAALGHRVKNCVVQRAKCNTAGDF